MAKVEWRTMSLEEKGEVTELRGDYSVSSIV